MRVKYATVNGTAQAGSDYVARKQQEEIARRQVVVGHDGPPEDSDLDGVDQDDGENNRMYTFPIAGLTLPLWLPILAACGITLLTSMVGISGAFLLVPFQLSVLGFASPAASATNLVFNLVAIPGGLYRYGREGRLFWPLALVIAAGGAPGTLVGAWLRTHWLAEQSSFEPFAGVILGYLAWRMLADWRARDPMPEAKGARIKRLSGNVRRLGFAYGDRDYSCGVPSLLSFSFLVGIIGTAYGIGGGSFMVPICLAVYRLPIHAIAGATLAATLMTSAIALAAYVWLPVPPGIVAGPDWLLGLAFGSGGLVGAYLGARLQRHVPQRWLKGCLGLLLLGLALGYALPATKLP